MKLIFELGLKGLNDFNTVLPNDIFSKINIDTVKESLEQLDMNDDNLIDTEESKFEYINRILMLKYGVFIDLIKDVDSLSVKGYRLEIMP